MKFKGSLEPQTSVKKVQRVIKFNQKSCVKPYIDMNTGLGKVSKSNFEKTFLTMMNNSVFKKAMEKV